MQCPDVLDRLVALEDGELGRSEELLVRRHLADCGGCASVAQRMTAAVPRPGLDVPAAVSERLARLDGAVLSRLAARPRPVPWPRGLVVPAPAAVGYALVLVLAVAWGLANWRERSVLEGRLAAAPPAAAAAPEIPAQDYRPASWVPEGSGESP